MFCIPLFKHILESALEIYTFWSILMGIFFHADSFKLNLKVKLKDSPGKFRDETQKAANERKKKKGVISCWG